MNELLEYWTDLLILGVRGGAVGLKGVWETRRKRADCVLWLWGEGRREEWMWEADRVRAGMSDNFSEFWKWRLLPTGL